MQSLEDEWYVVRHSGEIPEIALFSARHYLTEDAEGPRLKLSEEQWRTLVRAAEERYHEIVLRDLQQENRGSSGYRGIKRSIVNWRRFCSFCWRQRVDNRRFRNEVAATLLLYLMEELVEIGSGRREPSINCTYDELNSFALELGLAIDGLPEVIRSLCL